MIGDVNPWEYGAPGFSYVPDPFVRLRGAVGIWVSLGIEGWEILYNAESVLWAGWALEWAIELAPDWLD